MRFLVNAQLPPQLARTLARLGHEAGKHAVQAGAVIVTRDENFSNRLRRPMNGPSLVWLRMGNAGTSALLAWLLPRLPLVITCLERGELLVEVR